MKLPRIDVGATGPMAKVELQIGGGPLELTKHIVDYSGEPVDLSKASIAISAEWRCPDNSRIRVTPPAWRLRAMSTREVIATWYPDGALKQRGKHVGVFSVTINNMKLSTFERELLCGEESQQ